MKKQPKIKNLLTKSEKAAKRKKVALITALVLVLLPVVAVSVAATGFAIWANGIELDKSLMPTASAKPVFYDINGDKIEYLSDDYVNIEEIPTNLKNAFIALEDKRFYSHKGYDVIRMGGALLSNIKSHSVKEGASTITQQLVKNTHLSNERTINRKLKEIAIATKVEKEYSKDEILAMYLSVIYFGNGAYGVKQASRLYFDKDISQLTLPECAILAGIVKNPRKYSPFAKEEDCVNRRNLALSAMLREGYITEEEETEAAQSPLEKAHKGEDVKSNTDYCEIYIKKAIEEVCSYLGITKYQLNNSGYKIYTNLDIEMQKSLYDNENNASLFENKSIESVQVVIDNRTNSVVAYRSSLPYDVKRQAGSVMKPIAVYAPAIDMNIVSLSTPIIDEKIDFRGYSPSNFADKYYGDTTIRQAIQKSMNSVAVKTLSYVGMDKSAQYISNFGINIEYFDKNYALALGATANGVSPLEMANAYSAIANNGVYCRNGFVKYIVGDNAKITITNDKRQAIKPSSANILTSALIDTVKDGTARTLSALPFDVAAKTGTAQRSDGKNSDAWCIGYNNNYTVCVWHGNDEGMSERGGGYPAMHNKAIWQSISQKEQQEKMICFSSEVEWRDVDLYASKINRQVMLASENTPLEYRKSEIFPIFADIEYSTCFDNIPDFEFSLLSRGNRVEIEIETKKIYTYKVYRKDFIGEKLICQFDGSDEVSKTIKDTPLAFFDIVEYRIECEITSNPSIKKSSTKQVYVDDGFDDYIDDGIDSNDNDEDNSYEEDFDTDDNRSDFEYSD